MYLGIQNLVMELQELQNGSVSYVACSNRNIAINVSLSCLYHNSSVSYNRYFVVSDVDREEFFIQGYDLDYLLRIDAEVFRNRNKNNLLKTLVNDFKFMKMTKENSFIIVLFDEISLLPYEGKDLDKLLSKFSIFASRFNTAILFVSFGEHPEMLVKKISKKSHYISGLAVLSYDGPDLKLDTKMWRNNEGVFSHGESLLKLGPKGYEFKIDNNSIDNAIDNSICYTHVDALEIDKSLFNSIHFYNSNEDLFADASQKAIAATLIFCLSSRDQVDSLGKQIYELRTKRGNFLKIIIIEKVQKVESCVRSFFLECGTNFIFEATSNSDYINAMLPSLKSMTISKALNPSFENIIESYHLVAKEENGFLYPDVFVNKIYSIVSMHINDENIKACLLILSPKDEISIEECILRFSPKQGGDYCTAINNELYVFIPHYVENSFPEIFGQVLSSTSIELFKGNRIISKKNKILDELIDIKNNDRISHADEEFASKILKEHSLYKLN